ncbi:uncharacterized protein si:ch1073-126c3.2 [Hypomesus transpacificus]|uniref:uncharacterized protein si:ch1073-126c3.2 n=1 Tax=Hypomesus transpacificus TaxID=137520 RepID=UPI001F074758|nr:uncharacterized protein si:ch1073-126c3.2 [Hypomesus transpacificus]
MLLARTTAALICLCSGTGILTALSVCKSDPSKDPCSFPERIISTFITQLQVAASCAGNGTSALTDKQTAGLLDSVRTLAHILEEQQTKFCKFDFPNENPEDVTPNKMCPVPDLHKNGGLVCVTVKQTHYCKPMCNQGYDFSFLRRTRLYEKCSKDTGYKWTTQHIGGNKLAYCIASPIPVAGSATAYFPKNQDCLKTGKTDKNGVIDQLVKELETDQTETENACLICG